MEQLQGVVLEHILFGLFFDCPLRVCPVYFGYQALAAANAT